VADLGAGGGKGLRWRGGGGRAGFLLRLLLLLLLLFHVLADSFGGLGFVVGTVDVGRAVEVVEELLHRVAAVAFQTDGLVDDGLGGGAVEDLVVGASGEVEDVGEVAFVVAEQIVRQTGGVGHLAAGEFVAHDHGPPV